MNEAIVVPDTPGVAENVVEPAKLEAILAPKLLVGLAITVEVTTPTKLSAAIEPDTTTSPVKVAPDNVA